MFRELAAVSLFVALLLCGCTQPAAPQVTGSFIEADHYYIQSGFPSKTEYGVTISMEDSNKIFSDHTEHLYYVDFNGNTQVAYKIDLSQIKATIPISKVDAIPLFNKTTVAREMSAAYSEPSYSTREVCEDYNESNPIYAEREVCYNYTESNPIYYTQEICDTFPCFDESGLGMCEPELVCRNESVWNGTEEIFHSDCWNETYLERTEVIPHHDCRNETYQNGTTEYPATYRDYLQLDLGDTTDFVNTSLTDKWAFRLYTDNFERGVFNVTIVAGAYSYEIDPDISACGELASANTVYTMNASASIDGSTCFTVTAANVTLDCAGFSVTGNNSSGTYGIYSSQFNTTIRNCNISNFATGIYFYDSDNSTITNTSVTTTKTYDGVIVGQGIHLRDSANQSVSNVSISVTSGFALFIYATTSGTVENTTVTADSGRGVFLYAASNNNVLNNYKATSQTGIPIYIYSSNGNTINNSEVLSVSGASSLSGIYFDSSSNNNLIYNTNVTSLANAGISVNSGENNTIDCQGKSIIGANTSGKYGIYSSQFNTTIRNCNISNFATGIYFEGADNGTIENTTTHTTAAYSLPSGNGIYLYNGANYNTITGSSGYSLAGRGIMLSSSSSYNTISNSTGTAGTYGGIYLYSSSNYNTISNSTGTAGTFGGIYLYISSNNTISNSQINGKDNTYGALFIYSNCANNTIANSTINGLAATRAVTFQTGSNTGNLLINNTILNATTLLYLDANASGNTFCLNNFTATSGAYVTDLNGSNFYNCTYDSKNQGNIYANVMNGSVAIFGIVTSSIPPLYIGVGAYDWTSSQGKMAGGVDYAPLTPIYNSNILQLLSSSKCLVEGGCIVHNLVYGSDALMKLTANVSAGATNTTAYSAWTTGGIEANWGSGIIRIGYNETVWFYGYTLNGTGMNINYELR